MRYNITLADRSPIESDFTRLHDSGVLEYHDENRRRQFLSPSGWLHYGEAEERKTAMPRSSGSTNL
ncbi:hypothetical protein, partial [Dietzia cinnamea]|uniref:hypothetical protein n=1 Tax=Dietzia cinnamea TaxID=321318 RepID=UPI0021A3E9FA